MDARLPEKLEGGLELDSHDADALSPHEDWTAWVCRFVSDWLVVALVVMMGAEMLLRGLFNYSIQFSNEVGGYALVAITFLALASGQVHHAYHRVHFVENKLSPLGRAWLRLVFNVGSLAVSVVLLLEFIRFEWITFNSGDVAATSLMTPLWVPRLFMPIGVAALTWALLRTVAGDWRRVRAARLGDPAASASATPH
ncbi:MAG: TRAP transporter small permease [Comamonadaceae bacterium]|nr:MAG: TRAP transporter small permease [Comamonadaceae bacterium]